MLYYLTIRTIKNKTDHKMSWKTSGSIHSKLQGYHHWNKVKENPSWSAAKAFYKLKSYVKSLKTKQRVKSMTAKSSETVIFRRTWEKLWGFESSYILYLLQSWFILFALFVPLICCLYQKAYCKYSSCMKCGGG